MTIYGFYIEYSLGYDDNARASAESVIENTQLFLTESLRDEAYRRDKRFCEEHNFSINTDYKFTKEI